MRVLFIWISHHNRMFWRSKLSAFFTIALPLLLMLLFSSIFGGQDILTSTGERISFATFYVPALACFSAASATFTNIAITLTIYREERILKRVHGTPLRPEIYILATILSAVWIAIISSGIMMIVGIIVFDLNIIYSRLWLSAIFFFLGVVAFCLLGLAVSAFAKTSRSAPAVTNAIILPLSFISGIFIYDDVSPGWMQALGSIFPLKAFSEGVRSGFDPSLVGEELFNLGILLIWGAFGFLYMTRYFRWVPSAENTRTRVLKRV